MLEVVAVDQGHPVARGDGVQVIRLTRQRHDALMASAKTLGVNLNLAPGHDPAG